MASLSAFGWTMLLSVVLIALGWSRSPLAVTDGWAWTAHRHRLVCKLARQLFLEHRRQPAGRAVASLWVNLVPFFAVLWSMAYGFVPNAYQIAGGLVALSGVVYMQWRKLGTARS